MDADLLYHHVQVIPAASILSHKPRGTKGTIKPVNISEHLRVDRVRGKIVFMRVLAPFRDPESFLSSGRITVVLEDIRCRFSIYQTVLDEFEAPFERGVVSHSTRTPTEDDLQHFRDGFCPLLPRKDGSFAEISEFIVRHKLRLEGASPRYRILVQFHRLNKAGKDGEQWQLALSAATTIFQSDDNGKTVGRQQAKKLKQELILQLGEENWRDEFERIMAVRNADHVPPRRKPKADKTVRESSPKVPSKPTRRKKEAEPTGYVDDIAPSTTTTGEFVPGPLHEPEAEAPPTYYEEQFPVSHDVDGAWEIVVEQNRGTVTHFADDALQPIVPTVEHCSQKRAREVSKTLKTEANRKRRGIR